MSHSPFHDPRVRRLFSRVKEDVSQLRHDVGNLISHTTRESLPSSAKDLAETARGHVRAGGSYAASRLRSLRPTPPPKEAVGVAIGIAAVGLVALGVYCLLKKGCCSGSEAEDEDVSL